MNDWIIWIIMCLIFSEIIFIFFKIKSLENMKWYEQKALSIILGILIGVIHMMWLSDDIMIGREITFHWNRLIYEFYIIISIGVLFIINYFISKIIDKIKQQINGR